MTTPRPKRKGKKAPSSRGSHEWRFLTASAVEALHQETLAEHGGLGGVRDKGLLTSALSRCKNKVGYETEPTVHALAAALAYGLAKNHPFHDGNKRIALIASFTFAELNGLHMTATEAEAAKTFLALAAGEISAVNLARWFEAQSNVRRARK